MVYVDVFNYAANKYNEELCGDNVEIVRTQDSTIVVLADGLGSGVKANILSKLTTKIASQMFKMGAHIYDVVQTISETLPVCQVRRLAYSTFTIVQLFHATGEIYVAEYDSPEPFIFRNNELVEVNKELINIQNKTIRELHFQGKPGDVLFLVSDGVIHAGMGRTLNYGWQWPQVADYLGRLLSDNQDVAQASAMLLTVCDNLSQGRYGDDSTVVGVRIKESKRVNVLIGPPKQPSDDARVVKEFVANPGYKIVCGGTTAKLVSRELGEELYTIRSMDGAEPPLGKIWGVDLVTEGVLTLNRALQHMNKAVAISSRYEDLKPIYEDSASGQLARILLMEATEVFLLIGQAINPAHEENNLISTKVKLVEDLVELLQSMGKKVTLKYC